MVDALIRRQAPATSIVDPTTDPLWEAMSRESGSVFASPPWLRTLVETYEFEIEGVTVTDGSGHPAAGLPVARLGRDAGQRLVALPFSDFCDPMDRDGSGWPLIAESLMTSGLPIEVRSMGPSGPAQDPRFHPGSVALWHAIDIEPDEDRAWEGLAGSARRAIRKGRETGLEIRPGNDPLTLRAFYDLHLGVRKHKYGLLPQPYRFFEALAGQFGDGLVILGAWQGKTLVAAILYLEWAGTLYYKFNASSASHLELRPNDLLMWEGMRYAASAGLGVVDLGRTDLDHDSLRRYKAKYATRDGEITVFRSGSAVRDPVLGDVLGPVTGLLTRPDVPDDVTEAAADIMYRHFA